MLRDRTDQQEIIDNLEFSDPLLIDNLNDMDFLNHWLGYNRTLISGIHKVKKKYKAIWQKRKVIIADLGCGSGDSLRCIHDWANNNKHDCELLGIDGNAFVIAHAIKASSLYPKIKYHIMDILSPESFKRIGKEGNDIVTLNNICHHFCDKELIQLIEQLRKHTHLAIIINDLHRHLLAYWGIKILAWAFNFVKVTKHDGPLSVRKGFKKSELESILTAAGSNAFEIRWTWPFRWQVIIWNEESIKHLS